MSAPPAAPYFLLGPGAVWLVLFFVVPLYYMGRLSLESGVCRRFEFTWNWANYTDALSLYDTQFVRSFLYAGVATLLALLIAYPLAYAIAFKAGRWRNAAAVRGGRAVLHHLPDPDPRLGDDPLRPEPGGRACSTPSGWRRERPRAGDRRRGDRRPHLQLPARSWCCRSTPASSGSTCG